ncbi:MAG: DNA repair protein RadC [Lentisphaeria bacterium]|nr:DNA repair protein RadC [Lentisphaeria bacterium]NQZ68102.1 DNA repair protein RadC [Lentisphaeria bacterium]
MGKDEDTLKEEPLRTYLIADLPEHERPRERLLKRGSESLSDTELLAIILKTGPPGYSTIDLARNLLKEVGGSLRQLAGASPAELSKVHGIGPAKAAELKAVFAIAARLSEQIEPEQQIISSPVQIVDYYREKLQGKKQEELHALLLDTKNQIISDELITIGLLDRSQAHAREVFREAIAQSSSKIVLVHNHPSGDPTPSTADIKITTELNKAGKIVGIEIIDHIIIGKKSTSRLKEYASLKELDLL